ncbi:hypothetical protein [Motiliproteus sp. SC1-56]|uniref:hypothetical protein n=1 Tax=Motiliproteus sp. SC1-56 TaxID=2799565 RepID=UPI001A90A247|nr:hypothetical protein [Motiliproteus sp. SC1-56]
MPFKYTGSIPFGIGKVEWTPSTKEREAAWALYVEYSTRITRVRRSEGPEKDFGSARLAMDSLYVLLNATRQVLREAGPAIAGKPASLGAITIAVLNRSVRKLLDEFHLSLEAHEGNRSSDVSRIAHERKWAHYARFWEKMMWLQKGLQSYLKVLEVIAGVKLDAKKMQ